MNGYLTVLAALTGCASAQLAGCARGPDYDPTMDPESGEWQQVGAAEGGSDSVLNDGVSEAATGSAPVEDGAPPGAAPADASDVMPDPLPGPEQPDDSPVAEPVPASGEECEPGRYAGTFEGEITALFFINLPIAGEISVDVTQANEGPILHIDNGALDGTDEDGNPITATLSGQLDCDTKLLTGSLDDGVYVRQSINQTVNFTGRATGSYVPGDPPMAVGTWETNGGLEMSMGTFTAERLE